MIVTNNNTLKTASSKIADLTFDGNDIVEVTIYENAILTTENIIEQYQISHELTGGIAVRLIIDISGLKLSSVPKEVMEYMAKNEYNQYQKRVAIIIEGTAQKIIANIYTKIFKPAVDTKFFTNETDAKNWLNL